MTSSLKFSIHLLLTIVMVSTLSSCLVSRKPLQIQASTDVCLVSESAYYYDSLVTQSRKKYDTTNCHNLIEHRFSLRTINISRNIGAYDLLCNYIGLEKQKSADGSMSIAFLSSKYEINEQINIANADLTSTLAELDCEKARILEVKSYVDGWQNTRVNRLTVGSILTGAVGGIITGVVALVNPDNSNTEQQVASLAGAAASAYLGIAAMRVKKKIQLVHARNYLADFAMPPKNSLIYSTQIWSFITKEFSKKGKITTGRQQVLDKWRVLGLLETENGSSENDKLLLGLGGNYDSEQLQKRLDMLDIVVEEIDLIKYDLKRLQQEILLGYKVN